MRQISLVPFPSAFLTSYRRDNPGTTRLPSGAVPFMSQVLTVGESRADRFRASRGTVEATVALNRDMVDAGMEPLRLTSTYRPSSHQSTLRARYDRWVAAGSPEPGSRGYVVGEMSPAFAALPGRSYHGCGMAIDFDVGALLSPGQHRGSDACLAQLWELARPHGFSPIIAEPFAAQSEAWHLDHLGPLHDVRDLFAKAAHTSRRYRDTYGHTAAVGHALLGVTPYGTDEHYIQARLLIAGHFCGLVDGLLGPMTRAALSAAGITAPPGMPSRAIIAALDALAIGEAEIALA